MGVNHVTTADGKELINLMNDTVSEATLLSNETAHNAAGEQIVGQFTPYAPNLLDNGDFSVNQGGISGLFSTVGAYFVDRWKLVEGTVIIETDGTITLNGTIAQILEHDINEQHLAYASAGTASYDAATRTYTITSSGETIRLAMLIESKIAIPFNKASSAVEIMKCQRHQLVIRGVSRFRATYIAANVIDFQIPIPTTMRAAPTLTYSENLAVYDLAGALVQGFKFSVSGVRLPNIINLRATKTAHGLTDAYLVIPELSMWITFDANL